MLLVLSSADVHELLPYAELAEVMRAALAVEDLAAAAHAYRKARASGAGVWVDF